jgi:outer membrane receptor for ferrienterochelin and colicins
LPPVDLLRPYTADELLLVANFGVVKQIGCRHRLLTGLQYTYNDLEETGMYLDHDLNEAYVSSAEKAANDFGIYVQDEFAVTSKLELAGGIRYDYHSSQDEFRGSGDVLPSGLEPLEYTESTVNPRFSIKYTAADWVTLRTSVGTGFRVPYGFSEDLHLCSGSPRVYKGGDLKPEKSISFSGSADFSWQILNAGINLYRTELSNAISFAEADDDAIDLGYTYEWRNIDDAYVMGAEFNLDYYVIRDLTMSLQFELFKGEYDNVREDWIGTPYEKISKKISRFPETAGGLKLEYNPKDWLMVVDLDYKGKMYIDLTEPEDPADVMIFETDPFVTLSARISKNILNGFKVYFGGRNLTDYTQEEKHISDAAFIYAPLYGRILYGGIEISM